MMSVMPFSMIDTTSKKGAVVSSPPGLAVPSIAMEQGAKPVINATNAQTTPALLLELVTIVTQIAQLDAMFEKVRASAPVTGSEADKWHQVSVQALDTSRKYMVEQQTSILQRLANATGTQAPATAEIKNLKKEEAVAEPPSGPTCTAQDEAAAPANLMQTLIQGEGNSLRNDLEKIKLHNFGCALLIRKIKPLGFESPEHLRSHCEKFGQVLEVLVSHCVTKPSAKRAKGRIRPAALGFVVMASPEEAEKVFAEGEQQIINFHGVDVAVEVQRFRDITEESLV
jgi:hypothetical protein